MNVTSLRTSFRSSFQFKLFLIFTLLTALISILFSTLYIVSEISEARQNATDQVSLLTTHLADSLSLPLYAENIPQLRQLAEEAAHPPEILTVTITSADGRELVKFQRPRPVPSKDIISHSAEVHSSSLGFSVENALTGAMATSGTLLGIVRIDRGTSDLDRKVPRIFMVSIGMALLFWSAVSLLSFLVLKQVTSSFNALVQGVMRLQGGEYTARIEVEGDDEPGRASLAVNALAGALQQREEDNLRLTGELMAAIQQEVESREKLAAVNSVLEQEIKDRTRAEQAALQSEQTLRSLMDGMPVGVVWTNQQGLVEYTNRFFSERFGYGREEIVNLDDWFTCAFPDPPYREEMMEAHRSVLRNADDISLETPLYEARVTCRDDTVRHVLVKNQSAQERRIMLIIDITEREQLQEQLIKAQRLESLGVLAGGIAHNFNNVLTGVMGYISFAYKFLDQDHKAYMPLQHAEDASRRAAGMAKQLLTFARGGAPVKTLVSLRRTVDESISMALNGTNVQGVVEMPDDLYAIMADEGQLSQVFNNIIINAVQAMPKGGTLTVKAENLPANSSSQQPHVQLSFTDEGCGIPESNLTKIFDPYFTTKSIGTGLGLASVHSIITRHGGRISAESLVGCGSTFHIVLPATGVADQPEEKSEVLSYADLQGSGPVLVMDDEEMIRDFVSKALESLGYAVTLCSNGDEAVAAYRAAHEAGNPFRATILDLTVQHGMGGQEAADRILEFDPQALLVVSSGYSYNPVMAGFKAYGFSAAVTKPYKVDELGRQLSLLLTGGNGAAGQ